MSLAQSKAIEELESAVAYRWISRMFLKELDQATFASIKQGEFAAFLDDLQSDPGLQDPVELLRSKFERAGTFKDIDMDLRVAFAKLFLGAGGKKSAPPYASFYLTGRQNLHHSCVLELQQRYREFDLDVSQEISEPADHISFILGFLSALFESDASPEEVREFISKYISPWLSDFVSDCSDHDESGFYSALGGVLLALVTRDLRINTNQTFL